jgi:hypothetical protein
MRQPKRAVAVLRAALPTVLQHEHVWLQAEAYLTLAKCHLQIAQDDALPTRVATKHRQLAIEELERSVHYFEQCHDAMRLCEIYYLQARTYDLLSDKPQRDASASRFVLVSRYLASPSDTNMDNGDVLEALRNSVTLQRFMARSLPLAAS